MHRLLRWLHEFTRVSFIRNGIGGGVLYINGEYTMYGLRHVHTWQVLSDCYKAINFLIHIHKKTPHSSPVRVRYGVSFVDPGSDWYSASVPVIIYVISYNIGPRYNGTRLYLRKCLFYEMISWNLLVLYVWFFFKNDDGLVWVRKANTNRHVRPNWSMNP